MYNLEYYGFSLLCYVQRECNSHFRASSNSSSGCNDESGLDESSSSCIEGVAKVLAARKGASGRPGAERYIDYSRLEEVAELDLVQKWFGGVLGEREMRALGEACLEMGSRMVNVLWSVSQWTPDRKRSCLVMVDTYRARGKVIAASASNKLLSGAGAGAGAIVVTDKEMEQLCKLFKEHLSSTEEGSGVPDS